MTRERGKLPSDHGLASLGLVMQLGGTLFAASMALFTFGAAIASDTADTIWLLVLMATCVGRSLAHRRAGTELLYGTSIDPMTGATGFVPLSGVRRYITIGFLHSLVFVLLIKIRFDVSGTTMLGLVLGLSAWPAILTALFYTDVFAPMATLPRLPISEDKGFEGAAILMTVFGVCGLLATGTIVIVMFQAGAIRDFRTALVAIALVVLAVRSALHVRAGLSGLRTTSIDHSVALANRYASFGLVSSAVAAVAVLAGVVRRDFAFTSLGVVVCVAAALAAWPQIVRRFFADRKFTDLLTGKSSPHRRAPDAGLTGLGWLLLGVAAYNASIVIPGLVGGDPPAVLREIFEVFGSSPGRSPWWNAGLAMLEGWAGLELIRMSPHHRAVAMVYAIVSAAVTIYLAWPAIQVLKQLGHIIHVPQMLVLMPVAVALVVPVTTIILVTRETTPTARARYRSD